MKNFLKIIILFFSWSGNAYAGCLDDLDVTYKWEGILEGKKKDLQFKFKNKSNKNIIIAELGLKSKNGSIMWSDKPDPEPYDPEVAQRVGEEDFYLKPFGVSTMFKILPKLNLDVAGKPYYKCKYGKRAVVVNQSTSSSSSSSTSSKSKQKSNNSGSSKSLLKKLLGKD